MSIRRALRGLLAQGRKRRLDRELDDEIAAHLELAEREALEKGLTPEQARRDAKVRFGGVERVKEEHRDSRAVRWIETFWRDLRHGLGGLARDPGFAAVAVGALALGIGANTAMFSLVDATLLRPLPSPSRSASCVSGRRRNRGGSTGPTRWTFSTGGGSILYDTRLIDDNLRRSIEVAFGAVALVLLIACANVANLLLAKGVARRKEMAVRAALGASRGRLTVQLFAESLALCLLGGASGIALAQLLIQGATPLIADSLPYTAEVGLDARVLGFSAAAALGVSLLVGVLPSFRTSFTRLASSMNQQSRGSSDSREALRRAIVTGEVAVSLVLICGALLLLKSLAKLQEVDAGVRVGDVITMSIDLPNSVYPTAQSAASFYRALSESLRATPGVTDSGLASDLPLEEVHQGQGFSIVGREGGGTVRFKRVDHRYFETLGIPLLAGRDFDERDDAGAPYVTVINEQLAAIILEKYGIADPIGQITEISTPNYENSNGEGKKAQIVGVVSERAQPLSWKPMPVAYVPLAQAPETDLKVVIAVQALPSAIMPGIREAVAQVDPNLPLGNVRTMEEIRDNSLRGTKQPTLVIGMFAAVAAFLAALGLYGVLSHAVTQQRKEIGIRMALGAQSGNVLSQILRSAMALVAVGVAIGLVGAMALTRLIESLLFDVSALDPLAILTACAATVLVGLLAGFIPARRAARVEPMTVLRDEN